MEFLSLLALGMMFAVLAGCDAEKGLTTVTPPGKATFVDDECTATESTIKVVWTNPADDDIAKVKVALKKEGAVVKEEEYKYKDPDSKYETTFTDLETNGTTGVEYTVEITVIDIIGNKSESVAKIISTLADTKRSAGVSDVKYEILTMASGKLSGTLTWINPTEKFDHTTVQIGTGTEEIATGASYEFINLDTGTEIRLRAYDKWGNTEADNVVIKKLPALETIGTITGSTVEIGYTGQLVVSGFTRGTANSEYTVLHAVKAVCGAEMKVSSYTTNESIRIGGLRLGETYTLSINTKFVPKFGGEEFVVEDSETIISDVTPQIVVWEILGSWGDNTNAYIMPVVPKGHILPGDTAPVNVAFNFDGLTPNEINSVSREDYKFKYWIVWPSIWEDAANDAFSLEAVETIGTWHENDDERWYLYMSPSSLDVDPDYDITGKKDELGFAPQYELAYIGRRGITDAPDAGQRPRTLDRGVKLNSFDVLQDDDKYYAYASFVPSEAENHPAVPDGYEPWKNIRCEIVNSYWWGNAANLGLNPGTPSTNEYCYTWRQFIVNEELKTDVPDPITNLEATALSTSSIKLEWTKPNALDYSHVKISYDSKEITGYGTSCTITGLEADIEYTFTVTAYDAFDNSSTLATATAKTLNDNDPAEVTVKANVSTGIAVKWKGKGGYSYKVTAGTQEKTVNFTSDQTEGAAYFTGLENGTEINVTIATTANGKDYSTSAKATPCDVYWQLATAYEYDKNEYTLVPDTYKNTTSCTMVALKGDDASHFEYTWWKIVPALSGTEGYFSMIPAKQDGTTLKKDGVDVYLYITRDTNQSGVYGAWNNSVEEYDKRSADYNVHYDTSATIGDNKVASFHERFNSTDKYKFIQCEKGTWDESKTPYLWYTYVFPFGQGADENSDQLEKLSGNKADYVNYTKIMTK